VPARETPESLVLHVAQRIRELRHEAGLTQEQLAERLNVSVQYVSQIENGENLRLRTLADTARALGTRARSFFEDVTTRPEKRGRGRPPGRSSRRSS
jgi:transcriptional regulator with XRE-family HTH domain